MPDDTVGCRWDATLHHLTFVDGLDADAVLANVQELCEAIPD
jgi:hypothetical protein